MTRQIRKFDRQTSKAGTRPAGFGGPNYQLAEERVDYVYWTARQLDAIRLERSECPFVLGLEHRGEQRVLALEMIVQGALW